MSSPLERLEARKQVSECRVCAWLATLDEKARRDWALAIANPRFGHKMVAEEMAVDGAEVSDGSVANHRQKGHR